MVHPTHLSAHTYAHTTAASSSSLSPSRAPVSASSPSTVTPATLPSSAASPSSLSAASVSAGANAEAATTSPHSAPSPAPSSSGDSAVVSVPAPTSAAALPESDATLSASSTLTASHPSASSSSASPQSALPAFSARDSSANTPTSLLDPMDTSREETTEACSRSLLGVNLTELASATRGGGADAGGSGDRLYAVRCSEAVGGGGREEGGEGVGGVDGQLVASPQAPPACCSLTCVKQVNEEELENHLDDVYHGRNQGYQGWWAWVRTCVRCAGSLHMSEVSDDQHAQYSRAPPSSYRLPSIARPLCRKAFCQLLGRCVLHALRSGHSLVSLHMDLSQESLAQISVTLAVCVCVMSRCQPLSPAHTHRHTYTQTQTQTHTQTHPPLISHILLSPVGFTPRALSTHLQDDGPTWPPAHKHTGRSAHNAISDARIDTLVTFAVQFAETRGILLALSDCDSVIHFSAHKQELGTCTEPSRTTRPYIFLHSHTYTYRRTHMHTCTHTHTHTHTHMHTYTHTHTHTHMLTPIHTDRHTHMLAHAHVPTPRMPYQSHLHLSPTIW
jgi:hypothetical protein